MKVYEAFSKAVTLKVIDASTTGKDPALAARDVIESFKRHLQALLPDGYDVEIHVPMSRGDVERIRIYWTLFKYTMKINYDGVFCIGFTVVPAFGGFSLIHLLPIAKEPGMMGRKPANQEEVVLLRTMSSIVRKALLADGSRLLEENYVVA